MAINIHETAKVIKKIKYEIHIFIILSEEYLLPFVMFMHWTHGSTEEQAVSAQYGSQEHYSGDLLTCGINMPLYRVRLITNISKAPQKSGSLSPLGSKIL